MYKALVGLASVGLMGLSLNVSAGDYMYKKRVVSKSPVWDTTGEMVKKVGVSKIVRKNDKVCITLNSRNLEPGAYTSWIGIFNNPESCSLGDPETGGQCAVPDSSNLDTQATVMWMAADLVGEDGRIHLSTCYEVGELSHQVMPLGTQEGLIDPKGAEVHVIVRYHGPAAYTDATLLGEQLNSFGGGCAVPDQGVEGFACTQPQMTIHSPKMKKHM